MRRASCSWTRQRTSACRSGRAPTRPASFPAGAASDRDRALHAARVQVGHDDLVHGRHGDVRSGAGAVNDDILGMGEWGADVVLASLTPRCMCRRWTTFRAAPLVTRPVRPSGMTAAPKVAPASRRYVPHLIGSVQVKHRGAVGKIERHQQPGAVGRDRQRLRPRARWSRGWRPGRPERSELRAAQEPGIARTRLARPQEADEL